jgi:murein DD-endopeptidase MepM/ murein hydrolase activator NlpD
VKVDKPHGDAKVAAQQLEAFFLRQLLSETKTSGSAIDGGFAGDTFKQMLNEAIADKMVAAGGVGMASMFAKQLGDTGKQQVMASPTPSGVREIPSGVREIPSGVRETGPKLGDAPQLILPVAGRPSSGYGMRADPIKHAEINHPGFDLAAPTGTPVSAAAGGTVIHAGPAGTYGNLVTIRHDNGYETRYAHLSAVNTNPGERVEAGQLIGKVGTTGYSTGPHLHFEVRHDGKTIDPAPLLPLNNPRSRPTR